MGMSHADVERITIDAIKQTILRNRKEVDADVLEQAVERQRARIQVTEQSQRDKSAEPPPRSGGKGRK